MRNHPQGRSGGPTVLGMHQRQPRPSAFALLASTQTLTALARVTEAMKACQGPFIHETHLNSVGRCVDLASTESCQATRTAGFL